MEEKPEITNNIVDKSWTDPVTGKFVKGNPGGGRPPESLNFKTKWNIFIDKVAKQNDMTPDEIDEQLLAVGFKKAKEGDYSFYRDLHDRLYGKPVQPLGNANGEPFVINLIKYEDNNNTPPISTETVPVESTEI